MNETAQSPKESNDERDDTVHHDVNFFRPTSPHARANMKIIIVMVLTWAVAVFGFQILLWLLSGPTPEYDGRFRAVLEQTTQGKEATPEVQREFASYVLNILGKNIAVNPDEKAVLKEMLSRAVCDLAPVTEKKSLVHALKRVQEQESRLAELEKAEEDAPALKMQIAVDRAAAVAIAARAVGLEETGLDKLRRDLLPDSLVLWEGAPGNSALSGAPRDMQKQTQDIFNLYLVHNQSALTDFRFMGFPFHYWYTAQFLLIMFVLLCLAYAVLMDWTHRKYEVTEEHD